MDVLEAYYTRKLTCDDIQRIKYGLLCTTCYLRTKILPQLARLELLLFSGNKFVDWSFAKSVKHLSISSEKGRVHENIPFDQLQSLRWLGGVMMRVPRSMFPNIREMFLCVHDSNVNMLADLLDRTSPTSLILHFDEITDIQPIMQSLLRCSELRHLYLSNEVPNTCPELEFGDSLSQLERLSVYNFMFSCTSTPKLTVLSLNVSTWKKTPLYTPQFTAESLRVLTCQGDQLSVDLQHISSFPSLEEVTDIMVDIAFPPETTIARRHSSGDLPDRMEMTEPGAYCYLDIKPTPDVEFLQLPSWIFSEK